MEACRGQRHGNPPRQVRGDQLRRAAGPLRRLDRNDHDDGQCCREAALSIDTPVVQGIDPLRKAPPSRPNGAAPRRGSTQVSARRTMSAIEAQASGPGPKAPWSCGFPRKTRAFSRRSSRLAVHRQNSHLRRCHHVAMYSKAVDRQLTAAPGCPLPTHSRHVARAGPIVGHNRLNYASR